MSNVLRILSAYASLSLVISIPSNIFGSSVHVIFEVSLQELPNLHQRSVARRCDAWVIYVQAEEASMSLQQSNEKRGVVMYRLEAGFVENLADMRGA